MGVCRIFAVVLTVIATAGATMAATQPWFLFEFDLSNLNGAVAAPMGAAAAAEDANNGGGGSSGSSPPPTPQPNNNGGGSLGKIQFSLNAWTWKFEKFHPPEGEKLVNLLGITPKHLDSGIRGSSPGQENHTYVKCNYEDRARLSVIVLAGSIVFGFVAMIVGICSACSDGKCCGAIAVLLLLLACVGSGFTAIYGYMTWKHDCGWPAQSFAGLDGKTGGTFAIKLGRMLIVAFATSPFFLLTFVFGICGCCEDSDKKKRDAYDDRYRRDNDYLQ